MKEIILLLLFNFFLLNVCMGKKRTEEEMKILAEKALNDKIVRESSTTRSANSIDLREFKKMDKLSVFGLEGIGYVVISNDDRFRPLLGYSTSDFTKSEELPCGFKWWITTVNEIMKESESIQSKNSNFTSIRKTNNLPEHVDPLLNTKWGQSQPYNNQCVFTINGETISTFAGCTPIAMAQIMKFYEYPKRGNGSHTYMITNDYGTFYPSTNFDKNYDWTNMLDDYNNGSFSDVQANAVATLVYDCGVAVDTYYGEDRSPAGPSPASFMTYFDYDDCFHLSRKNYTYEEWLKMVYLELSEGRPILYWAYPESGDGHTFVIHGYNDDGFVCVNWGWNGMSDGYYDIDLLKGYSNGQEMIIIHQGLKGNETKDITILSPGTLQETLTPYLNSYHGVKISGALNDDDMQFIHSISGDNQYYNSEPAFYTIDLSDATIDGSYKNILPPSQFEGTRVKRVILPNNIIAIDDKAFNKSNICSIEIPATVKTIGEMAFANTCLCNVKIHNGVERIGEHCFVNDTKIDAVELPSSIKAIGSYAFSSCRGLRDLKLPEGLTYIGTWFISDCHLINEITLPQTLKRIESGAFGDTYLSSIYIPSCVDSIGNGLFDWNRSRMKRVVVSEDNMFYDSREDCNAVIETQSNKLVAACEYTVVPNSIVEIGDRAFENLIELKEIELPPSITKIGDYGFCGSGLERIDVPEGTDSIGRFCFSNCINMTSCNLPSSLVYLSRLSFDGNINLKDIWVFNQTPDNIIYDSSVRIFDDTTKENAVLHVPKGTIDKYKSLFEWKKFKNIVEIENNESAIVPIIYNIDSGKESDSSYFNLNGQRLSSPQKGINIKNGKKIFIRK